MLHSIRQFIEALQDPYGLTRTLGEIEVCRSSDGDPLRWVGNSAVVFKIRCGNYFLLGFKEEIKPVAVYYFLQLFAGFLLN